VNQSRKLVGTRESQHPAAGSLLSVSGKPAAFFHHARQVGQCRAGFGGLSLA
jgi:hypothetical protein